MNVLNVKILAMKRLMATVLVMTCAAVFAGASGAAYAYQEQDLEAEFLETADKMLGNSGALSLTPEQQSAIDDIVSRTKKELADINERMAGLKAEIDTAMWEASSDMGASNELVAGEYDLAQQKESLVVEAINALHGVLDEKQAQIFGRL